MNAVMYYKVFPSEVSKRVLSPDDVRAVCAVYDPARPHGVRARPRATRAAPWRRAAGTAAATSLSASSPASGCSARRSADALVPSPLDERARVSARGRARA